MQQDSLALLGGGLPSWWEKLSCRPIPPTFTQYTVDHFPIAEGIRSCPDFFNKHRTHTCN